MVFSYYTLDKKELLSIIHINDSTPLMTQSTELAYKALSRNACIAKLDCYH